MGSTPAPAPVAPAQPDPYYVAQLRAARSADLQSAQSDVAAQTATLAPMFGLGSAVVNGPHGAFAGGAINGLPSIAFAPLGGGR